MEGFSIISPLVLLMGLGAALRCLGFWNDGDVSCMSKLIYYIICPAMLFRFAMSTELDWETNLNLAKGIYLAVFLTVAAVFAAGRYLLKTPEDIMPISVGCSFRSNSILIGMPVVALVFGEAAYPLAAIYFAVTEVGYNFITLFSAELVMARGASASRLMKNALLSSARNPLLIGSALGLLCSALGLRSMPEQADKAFQIITNMAAGISMLMIGAGLKPAKRASDFKTLAFDLFIRFGFFPLTMLLALSAFGVEETLKHIIVIVSAAPCANITFVLTKELGLNYQKSAELIAASTLLFVLTMPFWLNVLGLV